MPKVCQKNDNDFFSFSRYQFGILRRDAKNKVKLFAFLHLA